MAYRWYVQAGQWAGYRAHVDFDFFVVVFVVVVTYLLAYFLHGAESFFQLVKKFHSFYGTRNFITSVIIIIIIIIIISFIQGIYTHIPETNYVPKEYGFAAIYYYYYYFFHK